MSVLTVGVAAAPPASAPAVSVRPWRSGDERLVAAAEAAVSPRSLYERFFTGGHRFPPRYLERLAANITAVAEVGGDVVGWAEVARRTDFPYAGELAVLVVDGWQHRGLGPRLAVAALDLARRRGLTLVHADVMDTNTAARRALGRLFGRRLQITRDEGVLHYVLPLVPAPGGFSPPRRAT